jgi:para-aminobenzoate synthetase/4-amino-4-deoxychorismate lyase
MTSTVVAESDQPLAEIFRALFPCASVVGAPKVAAMRIIRDLEASPRGIYTGALGFVAPGGRARFSVAIRSIVQTEGAGEAVYGVGSGIVWDSSGEAEWRECLLKAKALDGGEDAWGLLETMLWTPEEGFFLLDLHLQRIARSAQLLDVPLNREELRRLLDETRERFAPEPQRVRLTVSRQGVGRVEAQPLGLRPARLTARVAESPVCSGDPSLRVKTTRRGLYNAHLAASPGTDEVLLWNERREATEFCNGNLVARFGARHVTPPVSCGLLDGVFRQWLLGRGEIEEGVLPLHDIDQADEIFRINSVGRWTPVVLLARERG